MRREFLVLALIFLVACTTPPTAPEREDLVPQNSPSTGYEPLPEIAPPQEEQERLPENLIAYDHLAVSGAKLPQKVTFLTDDGVKIEGSYFRPDSVPAPTIIMLHMLGRSKGDYSKLAKAFQQSGFAVLSIDFRGHGGSVYKDSQRIAYQQFEASEWLKLSSDIAAAKRYLEKNDEMSSLGIMGASLGANAALEYASQDKDVNTIVLLSPGEEYKGILATPYAETFGNRPSLLLVSKEDQYASDSSIALNETLQGPHRLVVFQGDKHGTDMLLSNEKTDDEIFTWFSFYLS